MAHASGPAADNFIPSDFLHKKSGVHYRVYKEDGKVWLSFERPNDPEARGKRQLLYYVGSGRRGVSYLFAVDGFLFESPVNWYADRHLWDMAPAYGNTSQIPLNLPAYTSCLRCYFSGVLAPLQGTENRYPSPPFSSSGVTCEMCHGPGPRTSKAVPSSILPNWHRALRDAVCMQCHLEGKVAIEQPGRDIRNSAPGSGSPTTSTTLYLQTINNRVAEPSVNLRHWRKACARRSPATPWPAPAVTIPTANRPPRNALRMIGRSIWRVMAPSLRPGITRTNPTAPPATWLRP